MTRRNLVRPVVALLAAAGSARAQCGAAETILTNDRATGDEAFNALAADTTPGGWMVLGGARLDDNARGVNAGSVYTFLRTNGVWGQVTRFHAPDGAENDAFGTSVAFDDPYCIVGATGAGVSGAAYIFQRSGNAWTQVAKVNPAGRADALTGYAVAIEGSHALVGAPADDQYVPFGSPITGAGTAAAYYRNPQTGAWSMVWDFDPGTNAERHDGDSFGQSVAISGDWFVVGAPGWDIPVVNLINHGEVRAYRRTSSTTWAQPQKLAAPVRASGDQFGAALAVKGNVLAIGAPYRDDAGDPNVGAVYFYRLSGTTWQADGMVLPSDHLEDANFGRSIALGIDEAIVGGNHYLYHFKRTGAGQWGQYARYRDPDSGLFGRAVVTDGTWIVGGDHGDDLGGVNNGGAAYAFREQPFSADKCSVASPVSLGQYVGCNSMATWDTQPPCLSGVHPSPDVWFSYLSPGNGRVDLTVTSGEIDPVLTVYTECPATPNSAVACNDNRDQLTTDAFVSLETDPGVRYLIRVAGHLVERGSFTLTVGAFAPHECPADCDQSTGQGVLDVFDFLCFQNRFAAAEPWACGFDTSSGPGVCDIFDFLAFQNAFAAGCP